jgi:hypothetical protein
MPSKGGRAMDQGGYAGFEVALLQAQLDDSGGASK